MKGEECTLSSDLWSLGIIIYLIFVGKTPFKGRNDNETFDNILEGKFIIPESVPLEARDLIDKLLKLDPS